MTLHVKENELPFILKSQPNDYPALNIIVATDAQNGIGKDGKIPWKCAEDMQFFRRKTLGGKKAQNSVQISSDQISSVQISSDQTNSVQISSVQNNAPQPNTSMNALIFGRKTFESIKPDYTGKILPGRIKLIISASMMGQNYELPELTLENADSSLFLFSSFDEAINWCNLQNKQGRSVNTHNAHNTHNTHHPAPKIRNIYACGGALIYAAANHHPQLHKIYLTTIEGNHDCDVFYRLPPAEMLLSGKIHRLGQSGAVVNVYKRCNPHEMQYLAVMRNVLRHGTLRPNRTGIQTYSLFSQTLEYPLCDALGNKIMPLLTTKRVFFITCYKELLWFLAGGTNAKQLQAQNVHIWDGNSSREFLDGRGLHHYKTGQLGPVYGAQWRHFGGEYNAATDTMHGGIDQISNLITGLKTDPFSRRHVLSAWNPADLEKMALPPCHLMSIFYVDCENCGDCGDCDNTQNNTQHTTQPKFLNCKVIIRSNDMFLGHPFNVASYAALTHMIAAVCGMQAKRLVIDITDCHIYENHVEQVNTQLARTPYGFPTFCFSDQIEKKIENNTLTIEDFNTQSIVLKNYICWEAIKGEMAK